MSNSSLVVINPSQFNSPVAVLGWNTILEQLKDRGALPDISIPRQRNQKISINGNATTRTLITLAFQLSREWVATHPDEATEADTYTICIGTAHLDTWAAYVRRELKKELRAVASLGETDTIKKWLLVDD